MKRRSLAIAGAAVAAVAALGSPLQAQGSSLDQHSACMAGRVGAGSASPCDDGSAVYFSPAALALQGSAVSAGAAVVRSSNRFLYNPGAAPVGEGVGRRLVEVDEVAGAHVRPPGGGPTRSCRTARRRCR